MTPHLSLKLHRYDLLYRPPCSGGFHVVPLCAATFRYNSDPNWSSIPIQIRQFRQESLAPEAPKPNLFRYVPVRPIPPPERMPPGAAEVRHYHNAAQQFLLSYAPWRARV